CRPDDPGATRDPPFARASGCECRHNFALLTVAAAAITSNAMRDWRLDRGLARRISTPILIAEDRARAACPPTDIEDAVYAPRHHSFPLA
ncbi:MAG TPA: hypothetical protein VF113_00880, partial [Stellaceae bacterium]